MVISPHARPVLPRCQYKVTYPTVTGARAMHVPQGKSPPTDSHHQTAAVFQMSALALPHSKFSANSENEKGTQDTFLWLNQGLVVTRGLLRKHPLQLENAVKARRRQIMMCLGEMLGRYAARHPHATKTSLIKAHNLTLLGGQDPSLTTPSTASRASLMC